MLHPFLGVTVPLPFALARFAMRRTSIETIATSSY
jgi:hypothetical protein